MVKSKSARQSILSFLPNLVGVNTSVDTQNTRKNSRFRESHSQAIFHQTTSQQQAAGGERTFVNVGKELIMARGFNLVWLVGTLTKAVELRYTPSGTAIGELNLAGNDHVFTDGKDKELAWYNRATLFGKPAEWLAERNPAIGTPILVEGGINYRSWKTPEGIRKSALDVKANRVALLTFGARTGETTVLDSKQQPRLKNAFNEVILIGNLTRDADLRYTPSGHAVTTTGLVVSETRGKGEKAQEITHFIDLQLWRDLAEASAELKKGQAVFVRGRLVNDSWVGENDEKHYITRLEVNWLETLDSARENGNKATPSRQGEDTSPSEDNLPF
jgi:single-strand DNA-binding protein